MGAINTFDLKQIREKKNINTFFETGTLHGDGVMHAKQAGFRRMISVEIDPNLFRKAQGRFNSDMNVASQVMLYNGNSFDILKEVLPQIDESILFWLDAHFPGADVGLAKYDEVKDYDIRVPLEKELEIILEHSKKYKDIIICDDLWVYEEGGYESGSFNNHMKAHGHNVTKEQICGHTLDNVYKMYEETHNIKKFYKHQGYLVLEAK